MTKNVIVPNNNNYTKKLKCYTTITNRTTFWVNYRYTAEGFRRSLVYLQYNNWRVATGYNITYLLYITWNTEDSRTVQKIIYLVEKK